MGITSSQAFREPGPYRQASHGGAPLRRPYARYSVRRRESHPPPLETPGFPPEPLPPIECYSATHRYIALDWNLQLRSAGHPCEYGAACPWRAGMGEVFATADETRGYLGDQLVRSYAAGAPKSTCFGYVARVQIDALPLRDFTRILSIRETSTAIQSLAHGEGAEPWWATVKREDCGGLLLSLPSAASGSLLVVLRRFEHHLRIEPLPGRIELPGK